MCSPWADIIMSLNKQWAAPPTASVGSPRAAHGLPMGSTLFIFVWDLKSMVLSDPRSYTSTAQDMADHFTDIPTELPTDNMSLLRRSAIYSTSVVLQKCFAIFRVHDCSESLS